MTRYRGRLGAIGAALLVGALVGCVRAPMSTTLPPLVEERVPGSYNVEFRAGSTATPGLQNIDVSFMLDRQPVTADDLEGVIDAIFETNSLALVSKVSISAYTEDTDDGFGCLDLGGAIDELELSAFASAPFDCTKLLADFDDLQEWRKTR